MDLVYIVSKNRRVFGVNTNSTETAIEFGEHSLSKCINKTISNVTEHDDLNAQTSELYVLPSAKNTCTDTDKADYL